MMLMILTNNEAVAQKYLDRFRLEYREATYREILLRARDMIHRGHRLLTHPLSGSVKPNETPFKTILLSEQSGMLDLSSLDIIEKSIEAADKFTYADRPLQIDVLEDFRCIDMSLMDNVINKLI